MTIYIQGDRKIVLLKRFGLRGRIIYVIYMKFVSFL